MSKQKSNTENIADIIPDDGSKVYGFLTNMNVKSLLLIEKYYRNKYNKQPHHTLIIDEYNNIHKGYTFHYSNHVDFNYTNNQVILY